MKQYIEIEQLLELSDKGKERLIAWWKPMAGDFFITKYSPTYVVYGRDEDMDGEGAQLLTDQPVDSGFYGWNITENFPPDRDTEEEKMNRYLEVRKDALPCLSIGQMIEFLIKEVGFNLDYSDMDNTWGVRLGELEYGNKELCDALWEAVKSDLEKT